MRTLVFIFVTGCTTLSLAAPLKATANDCIGDRTYSTAVADDCTTISGDLVINGAGGGASKREAHDYHDVDGLYDLTFVGGNLSITSNSLLANINGLATLETVIGGLTIRNNDSLPNVNGLGALGFLGTFLHIMDNEGLTNVDGLSGLDFLGGPVLISQNSDLCDASVDALFRALGIEVGVSPSVFAEDNNGECVPAALFAATLPSSRSVMVGGIASAYATMINAGAGVGYGCTLTLGSDIPAILTSWETSLINNEIISDPDPSVNIAPGSFATWAFRIVSLTPISPTDVELRYECANAPPTDVLIGINTLLLSVTSKLTPDIVAIAVTATGDGILRIDGSGASAAFATATVNVGLGGTITASARKSFILPGMSPILSICQTDPLSGACTSDIGPSVTTTIDSDDTPTFSVFVTAEGPIPLDPANFRIFIEFTDSEDQVRGSSSVAVTTEAVSPEL